MPDSIRPMRAIDSSPVLWGLFCACSWTWCIGMYLPRIMIDRFGWPGFLAFALPNVLGCAAFGYVVKSPARSRELVKTHGTAMTWFSVVTIAYHMFFISFLFDGVLPGFREVSWLPAAAAFAVLVLGAVLSRLPDRQWLWLTIVTYGVSLSVLCAIGFKPLAMIHWRGDDPASELAWLAPVIVFGFLLCPYLDLTFHRALQRSSSRHAFSVFGLAFALMLVLTCVIWSAPMEIVTSLAVVHITLQAIFTVGAHCREIRQSEAIPARGWRWMAIASPLIGAAIPVLSRMAAPSILAGEAVYLRFLVFYGLVFPLYAWVFMWPPPAGTSRRMVVGFFLAIMLCLPAYEAAFLHGAGWTLMLALALMAAAKPVLTCRSARTWPES